MIKSENKISLAQWNELNPEGKEKLRIWAVHHGYELDMIPGNSGTFDPICDYAALLNIEQMIFYLQEQKSMKITGVQEKEPVTVNKLWKNVKLLLGEHLLET